MNAFNTYGIAVPEILLPAKNIDLQAWSVIACDQYTQDKDYWKRAADAAAGKPSALNIILPEVYLNSSDKQERISRIQKTMRQYIDADIFREPFKGFIYVERTTEYGRKRRGLIAAVDLETYEWKPFSKSLIRATEATITERIPPRMDIRRGAALESPHIMLLINDPGKTLIEATGEAIHKENAFPLYDTDLMLESGHITGWAVQTKEQIALIENALADIARSNTDKDGSAFMFAVGDGNHSLATAKAVWDEFKQKNGGTENAAGQISIPCGLENHNARFALVEIVNLHDSGLTFEPIHRVLFNVNPAALIDNLCEKLNGTVSLFSSAEELKKAVLSSKASFGFVYADSDSSDDIKFACLETQNTALAVSRLQPALDAFLASAPAEHVCKDGVCRMVNPELDYVHGSEEVFRLGGKNGATGILLPPIAKDCFFSTISENGPLPRKSFSMGEASEKRFYLECRKLF
ncbi:MAG: DUF1015 domain-containing protein [Bacteroides sp.]|nr:DUF1015 domain-containing protein [Prevotella sp.]MCM1408794.1 DUF1015 domain-containing protein [Treponema brennaborense]MCM1470574.1 DUF1015 domain-containing protein [Bacteroides sp.]